MNAKRLREIASKAIEQQTFDLVTKNDWLLKIENGIKEKAEKGEFIFGDIKHLEWEKLKILETYCLNNDLGLSVEDRGAWKNVRKYHFIISTIENDVKITKYILGQK